MIWERVSQSWTPSPNYWKMAVLWLLVKWFFMLGAGHVRLMMYWGIAKQAIHEQIFSLASPLNTVVDNLYIMTMTTAGTTWNNGSQMLEAKCHHSCGLVSTQSSGQEIVLVGGTTGTGDGNKYSRSVQIYNINGNIWRQGDLLIFGESHAHWTKICIIIYQLLTPYILYLYMCTRIAKRVLPRLSEFCYCCCLPFLPQLAYSILATWKVFFWWPLYWVRRSLDDPRSEK